MSSPLLTLLANVSVNPTTAGMPGAQLVQQLLNWLSQPPGVRCVFERQ